MLLYFGDIVCHIVNEPHAEQARRDLEERDECLASPMHEALPVSPRVVGRSPHGRKIILGLLAPERCACELPVGQFYFVFPYGAGHHFEKVGAYLMAETSRARMNHNRHMVLSLIHLSEPTRPY